MGRERRHQPCRPSVVGPFRQLVQPLQRRRQRAVAHRRGIGKANPHQHIARRPGADAALGGEFLFRRHGRALRAGFRYPARPRHRRGGIRSDIAPWSGNSGGHAAGADAEIGHPLGRGMGAHVADLFARQHDHLAAQAAGEFDVDLLADDAPGQAHRTRSAVGQAQAPARRGEIRRGGFRTCVTSLLRPSILSAASCTKAMPARPELRSRHAAAPRRLPFSRLISSTAGPSSVGKRLPDPVAFAALGEAFGIAGVIGENFLRPVAGGKLDQEHLRRHRSAR